MSMQPLIYVDSWYLEKLYIHVYTVKQDNYSIFISYHEISYHIISYTYIYICHNYRYACIYIYKHILYMPQMETAAGHTPHLGRSSCWDPALWYSDVELRLHPALDIHPRMTLSWATWPWPFLVTRIRTLLVYLKTVTSTQGLKKNIKNNLWRPVKQHNAI